MLAAATHCPELDIGEEPCRRLAVALNEVQKHYPLPAISPGKMALATLIWTAGSIYVPVARSVAARRANPGTLASVQAPVSRRETPPPLEPNVPAVSEWFVPPGAPN